MKPSEPSSVLPSLPPKAEVLILRLRSLGDVVLTTPALAALHEWRPDLRLAVMIEPPFAAVLEGNPGVCQTLLFRSFAGAVRELRRRHFSVVFNHHGGPTSALLAAAAGAPVRVCWGGVQFSFFYNVLVPGPEAFYGARRVHSVEHRLTQFYWTGLPRTPIPAAKVYPQADAVASVEQELVARGIAFHQPYAVLHPGAAFFTRRWDVKNFAALARWLRDRCGLAVVVSMSTSDREIAPAVREHLAPHATLLDSLDLRELIALIGHARLFVGHDTGPAHIAAAAGCPVVMIFGSSSSVNWRPWHVAHCVVQNDFPCNPCPGDRCYAFDEPRCILSVTVEQVQEACRTLLQGNG